MDPGGRGEGLSETVKLSPRPGKRGQGGLTADGDVWAFGAGKNDILSASMRCGSRTERNQSGLGNRARGYSSALA